MAGRLGIAGKFIRYARRAQPPRGGAALLFAGREG